MTAGTGPAESSGVPAAWVAPAAGVVAALVAGAVSGAPEAVGDGAVVTVESELPEDPQPASTATAVADKAAEARSRRGADMAGDATKGPGHCPGQLLPAWSAASTAASRETTAGSVTTTPSSRLRSSDAEEKFSDPTKALAPGDPASTTTTLAWM